MVLAAACWPMATRAIRDLDGFASNLRGERSRRGFTQEQLAHET
jgi:hypothetical protein